MWKPVYWEKNHDMTFLSRKNKRNNKGKINRQQA